MFIPVYDDNGDCEGFQPSTDWEQDCMRERGKLLTGKYAHWCPDWDFLTIDETCPEWPCACAPELKKERKK